MIYLFNEKIFSLSVSIVVTSLMSLLQIGVSSCTKEVIVKDIVTVRDTVTIVKQDTALSVELLTANPWKLQEYRGVEGNMEIYYLRRSTNNTGSFDNEYISFNADKTGIYHENTGADRILT